MPGYRVLRWLKATGLFAFALLATARVGAITFSFPFPGSSDRDEQPPGAPPWQFRPWDMNNARGVSPNYQAPGPEVQGQMPGQMQGFQPGGGYPPGGGYAPRGGYPGAGSYPQGSGGYQPGWPGQYGAPYGQPQGLQAGRPPRLELEVSDHQPYVQENVLLKLRVVSDQNLETATPELPNSNDVLIQKLEGPSARSRTGGDGQREIVNEFIYTITPLRAGDIEVPRLTVSGKVAGGGYGYGRSGGGSFEVESRGAIRLQVRPAMASVRPWLPLQDLSLNATLDGGGEVEAGQPVTLALELSATGAAGGQLPSLEPMLRNADFRVYREQTLTEGKLSADGRRLEGKRTEYYTLVPRSGGKLQLPEMRLAWWNVTTGTQEHAGLPIRTLQVEGEGGPFGLSASSDKPGGGGVSWFWLPLVGLLLLLVGYWGGVWLQGRAGRAAGKSPLVARLRAGIRAGAARASAGAEAALAGVAKRLDPTPLVSGIQSRLTQALPPSTRFLMCVRAADGEPDPAAWAERFQDMTCRHLQFDGQTPLPGIAGRILSLRPNADPEQVQRLMQQLDAALYGKQDIDFPRWKQQFRRQVSRGRGLLGGGGARPMFRRPLLPALNPQVSG